MLAVIYMDRKWWTRCQNYFIGYTTFQSFYVAFDQEYRYDLDFFNQILDKVKIRGQSQVIIICNYSTF